MLVIALLLLLPVFPSHLYGAGEIPISSNRPIHSTQALLQDSDGVQHVAWFEAGSQGLFDLHYISYSESGEILVGDTVASSGMKNPSHLAMSIDSSGDLHFIWQDDISGLLRCTYLHLSRIDFSVLNEHILGTTTRPTYFPAMAIDEEDNVHMIYKIIHGGGPYIFYTKVTKTGIIEEEGQVVSPHLMSRENMNGIHIVIGDPGTLHVSWKDYNAYARDYIELYYVQLDSSGNKLTSISTVAGPSLNIFDSMLESDGQGGAYISYSDNVNDKRQVLVQRISSVGIPLGDPIVVSSSPESSDQPDIKVDSQGKVYVCWIGVIEQAQELFFSIISPDGEIVINEVILAKSSNLTNPRMVLASDNLPFITWKDNSELETLFGDFFSSHDLIQLTLRDLRFSMENATENSLITIYMEMANDGGLDSIFGMTVTFLVDDVLLAPAQAVAQLTPGSTRILEQTWIPTRSGVHEVAVLVDFGGKTKSIQRNYVVFGSLDASKVEVTSVQLFRGFPGSLEVDVVNQGETLISGLYANLTLGSDGVRPLLTNILLESGQKLSIQVGWTPNTDGNTTLILNLDHSAGQAVLISKIWISPDVPKPDILIGDITLSNEVPNPGENILARVEVKNNGTISTSAVSVELIINDDVFESQTIAHLPVGTSKYLMFDFALTRGDAEVFLEFKLDGESLIDESNETNNVKFITLVIEEEGGFGTFLLVLIWLIIMVSMSIFYNRSGRDELVPQPKIEDNLEPAIEEKVNGHRFKMFEKLKTPKPPAQETASVDSDSRSALDWASSEDGWKQPVGETGPMPANKGDGHIHGSASLEDIEEHLAKKGFGPRHPNDLVFATNLTQEEQRKNMEKHNDFLRRTKDGLDKKRKWEEAVTCPACGLKILSFEDHDCPGRERVEHQLQMSKIIFKGITEYRYEEFNARQERDIKRFEGIERREEIWDQSLGFKKLKVDDSLKNEVDDLHLQHTKDKQIRYDHLRKDGDAKKDAWEMSLRCGVCGKTIMPGKEHECQ